MQRSIDRILTHTGSLPRNAELLEVLSTCSWPPMLARFILRTELVREAGAALGPLRTVTRPQTLISRLAC